MIIQHEFKFTDLELARQKQEELVDKGHSASLKYTGTEEKPDNIKVIVRFNW
jgi:hypothetical protein